MRGRFFKGFQQSVEGSHAEHVDFIDNIDFKGAVGRHILDVFPQLPDLIDTVVGRAINLKNVDRVPRSDLCAGPADIAGFRRGTFLAIHRFGQDAGDGCLTGAARSGEQYRVSYAARRNRVGQGAGDMCLFNNLIKGLRAILTSKNKLGHSKVPKIKNA
jgi:hypothetical protein